jgi:hypothetical protein
MEEEIHNAVQLENDENIEYYWRGATFYVPRTSHRPDFIVFDGSIAGTKTSGEGIPTEWRESETGDFLLTSNRLVWLTPIGLLKKSLATQFALRFSEIQEVALTGGFTKKIVITTENGVFGFNLKNIGLARDLIQEKVELNKHDLIQLVA